MGNGLYRGKRKCRETHEEATALTSERDDSDYDKWVGTEMMRSRQILDFETRTDLLIDWLGVWEQMSSQTLVQGFWPEN